MFRILVRCPETGKTMDTGMETSGREALNSSVYQDGTVVCRHCGQSHALKNTAFLELVNRSSSRGLWRPNP